MATLAALKVKITLNTDGTMHYPDFNSLPAVSGDWSHWIDNNGTGWLYENCCSFEDAGPESPEGEQYGIILAPEVFVDQAVATFPGECTRLTEAQAEAFYNQRHANDFEDELVDEAVVNAIKLKQDLGQKLTPSQKRALDPRDQTPGIRENRRKHYRTFKKDKSITFVEPT